MKSRRLGAATAALAVALAVPTGVAAAKDRGHHNGHGNTLRLTATQTADEFLDFGAPGPSTGDQIVFADTLKRDGRNAGEDGGSCTVTTVDGYDSLTANCVATLRLHRGQITVQGLVTFNDEGDRPFTVAITGGTGAYRGASGEMRVRPISDTKDVYTLRLD